MEYLGSKTLDVIRQDLDLREEIIRKVVVEVLAAMPQPDVSADVVATYFVVARSISVEQVGREIAYHATTGLRSVEAGSLLAECTGRVVDAVNLDPSGRVGVVRVAFPLKMLVDEQGDLYSTDILHIVASAGVFALLASADIKLVHLALSEEVMRMFPGPAYGAPGVRLLTNFAADETAFGTILKPCTGITPAEEARIVAEVSANPLFMFIKEDENFLPGVSFAPLEARLIAARDAIRSVADRRGDKGLIYAPHISSPPQLLADNVKKVIDAGLNGVMFSEYQIGGAVRLVREMTRRLPDPPAIYGHNGGITSRTRHIYREVLDLLARLDGIDFRQTALLRHGPGILRPAGLEWRECERVLAQPLAGHPPVMITRAGGLDQGNIISNLLDVQAGAGVGNYLFLAGSAVNGIKNEQGQYDPAIGAEAMRQALEIFGEGVFTDAASTEPSRLKSLADGRGFRELGMAIGQRYAL